MNDSKSNGHVKDMPQISSTTRATSPSGTKSILKTSLSSDSNSSDGSNDGAGLVVKRRENSRRKTKLDDTELDPLRPKNNMSAFNIWDSIELAHKHTGGKTPGSWEIETAARTQFGSSTSKDKPSGKLDWQLEAEKRKAARNGRYTDPEKCPTTKLPDKTDSKLASHGGTKDILEQHGVFFNKPTDLQNTTGMEENPRTDEGKQVNNTESKSKAWMKSPNRTCTSPISPAHIKPPAFRSNSPSSRTSSPQSVLTRSAHTSPRSGFTSPTSGYASPSSGFTSPTSGYMSPSSIPTSPVNGISTPSSVFSSHFKTPTGVQIRNRTLPYGTDNLSGTGDPCRRTLHPERISFTEELHPDSVTRPSRPQATPSWLGTRPQPLPPTKSTPKRRVSTR